VQDLVQGADRSPGSSDIVAALVELVVEGERPVDPLRQERE
jgi:hypothetical protein